MLHEWDPLLEYVWRITPVARGGLLGGEPVELGPELVVDYALENKGNCYVCFVTIIFLELGNEIA